jgi:hypothetical protein
MKTLLVTVAALLVFAFPCLAEESMQQVLRQVTVSPADGGEPEVKLVESMLDPSELEDRLAYRIQLTAWEGEDMVLQTDLEMLAGTTAIVRNSRRDALLSAQRPPDQPINVFTAFVTVDAAGNPPQGYVPPVYSGEEQAALEAAQKFVFDDLTLHVYIPEASRVEVNMFTQEIPAGFLERRSGQVLPVLVQPDRPAELALGTIAGRLATSELKLQAAPGRALVIAPDGSVRQL